MKSGRTFFVLLGFVVDSFSQIETHEQLVPLFYSFVAYSELRKTFGELQTVIILRYSTGLQLSEDKLRISQLEPGSK